MIAIILAALLAAQPSAELWRGAAWGDALDAVRRKLPNATAPLSKPQKLTDGAAERLVVEDAQEGGVAFTARLYFDAEGLKAVRLTRPLTPKATAANMAAARRLADRLDNRLGERYDCGDRSVAGVASFSCKWLKGERVAWLTYIDTTGDGPMLALSLRRIGDPNFAL